MLVPSFENFNSFDEIINSFNNGVFDGELADIIEVTYKYRDLGDGKYWNETLLGDFGECSPEMSYDFVRDTVSQKLHGKIDEINYLLTAIGGIEQKSENFDESEYSHNPMHIRIGILKGSLVYTRNSLNMALLGLPFELEKAGYYFLLSPEDIASRVSQIEHLEKENFGGKVSDNQHEITQCIEFLRGFFALNSSKLTKEEKEEFMLLYQKLESILPEDERQAYASKLVRGREKQQGLDELLQKQIPQNEYVEIFDIILNEIFGLNFEVRLDAAYSSIYDGEGYIGIPSNFAYESLSVRRVLELIVHEIEAHCLNLETNRRLLGNFRGAKSVVKEEALAMLLEDLLMGKQIEEIGIVKTLPLVLAGEILEPLELERYLELFFKMDSLAVGNVNSRLLRVKRNYPMGEKGCQHKDTSYSRGKLELQARIIEGKVDIRDYFLGKVSIEDIPKMKRLVELEGGQDKVLFPLMIGEMLLYHLYPVNGRSAPDFYQYICEKYPFIDFSDERCEILSRDTKMKVAKVLRKLRG